MNEIYKLYVAKLLLAFYLLILGIWVVAGLVGIIVGAVGKLGSEQLRRRRPLWFCNFSG